jgi:hypothetical protein
MKNWMWGGGCECHTGCMRHGAAKQARGGWGGGALCGQEKHGNTHVQSIMDMKGMIRVNRV